ncbi:MAG: Gfo/Idh/MocA family oxidoreductase [Armatimonadetes bacterium]|nr:Gfo/Idh/MocA family oxidoreductase [Armatimonadota bacterium]
MRSIAPHDTVGYGVIGCGVISSWHIRSLKEHVNGAQLVAVCDEIPARAEKAAREFEIPRVYTRMEDILADPEVDAVSICLPSGMHSDAVIAASNAGKHVMTEKPIDIHLKQIDEMIAVTRKNGTRLGVIFQRRAAALWQKIRETVQAGKLGRMVLGDAFLKYYRSQEYYDSGAWRGTRALDGGGALMNQGVHLVDQLQWIMGPVAQVFGYADHLARNIEVEDTTVSALRYRSGAFGTLIGTTSVIGSAEWERDARGNVVVKKWGGLDHRLEFHGDHGTIMVDGERIVRWVVPGEPEPDFAGDGVGSAASDPTAIGMSGHILQLQDFVDAIREGRDPMVTGEDGRASVEIILAIYKSARTGQPVNLPFTDE